MNQFDNLKMLYTDSITVGYLMNSPAKLNPAFGDKGLENIVSDKHIDRPQLALAGYLGLFNFKRLQVFGNTEFFYLRGLEPEKRYERFTNLVEFPIPCIVVTNGHRLEDKLEEIAMTHDVPILYSEKDTTKVSYILSEFLDDQFAPQSVVHGSFTDVYGVGILFVGKSGIGKSEIALDLVERGHRLVADDAVMLTKKRESVIMGTGTTLVQHFMEIRGLGIIDIRQMFGIRSIRYQKRLEIIVELEEWDNSAEYDRTGLDEEPKNIMEVEISTVKLPIFPGKNITVIAESIATNYLLRTYGYNASEELGYKVTKEMKRKKSPGQKFQDMRNVSWLQGDSE